MSLTPRLFLIAGLGLLVLNGCERAVITGAVLTAQGEALPGVAVETAGAETEALTNGLGEYAIPFEPGRVELTYSKTGYASGRQRLELPESRRAEASTVRLWRLPEGAGVYLVEGGQFRELTRVEPTRFFTVEDEAVYGTARPAESVTTDLAPMIVCYKTPRYDTLFSKLVLVEAKRRAGQGPARGATLEMWVAEDTQRVSLVPLDEGGETLFRVRLPEGLNLGTYAVHWGALDGYTALEERIFTFRVEFPPEEAAVPAEVHAMPETVALPSD